MNLNAGEEGQDPDHLFDDIDNDPFRLGSLKCNYLVGGFF